MTNLTWAVEAFEDGRNLDYAKFARYSAGEQPLEFATPKYRSAFGRTFEPFAYNRCAAVVDGLADRLRITGWDADDKAARERAQELWTANTMDVHEGTVNREAFMSGEAYVVVEKNPTTGEVYIWPQSAANVRVQYDAAVPGRIVSAAKRWQIAAPAAVYKGGTVWTRLNVYTPGRVEKWVRTGHIAGFGGWQKHRDPGDMNWPVRLDVPDMVPVFHFANNARVNGYGRSELADVVPIQDALNKTLMDLLVSMEFSAFPQRWMIDVDTSDTRTVENIKKFVAGVNQILSLQSKSDGTQPKLGEFAASDVRQYTDVVELFDQIVSRVSGIPAYYLSMPNDPPSGESLKMVEGPRVAKVENRQRAFGAVWRGVMRYAMRLTGIDVPAGTLRPVWAPALPLPLSEKLENAQALKSLGLPLATVLRHELGWTQDMIEAIKDDIELEQLIGIGHGAAPPTPDDDDDDSEGREGGQAA